MLDKTVKLCTHKCMKLISVYLSSSSMMGIAVCCSEFRRKKKKRRRRGQPPLYTYTFLFRVLFDSTWRRHVERNKTNQPCLKFYEKKIKL